MHQSLRSGFTLKSSVSMRLLGTLTALTRRAGPESTTTLLSVELGVKHSITGCVVPRSWLSTWRIDQREGKCRERQEVKRSSFHLKSALEKKKLLCFFFCASVTWIVFTLSSRTWLAAVRVKCRLMPDSVANTSSSGTLFTRDRPTPSSKFIRT